jgi:hypothetical protein
MNLIRLLEATADIAYNAGHLGFTTGDSRNDVSLFIHWAEEFYQTYAERCWDEHDYILLIDDFVDHKIKAEIKIMN